ncbi:MAG: uroporphyrinogen decarboxylase family protein [Candidatus Latescibacterota bacterium]
MPLTPRQRYLETACFGSPDRAFLLPPWAWQSTLDRWRLEGLPPDADLAEHFATDRELGVPLSMQGPYGPHLHPPLERRVLSQTDEHVVVRDEEGNTVRLFRSDPLRSMPEWIEYPVRHRADWEEVVRPRLDAAVPGRRPTGAAWERFTAEACGRTAPLGIWCGSFYGWPRSFLGVERLSFLFYDDPRLVHDMVNHIADFVLETVGPILAEVPCDLAYIWEDMAGKSGPLCSPQTYRRFMLSPLKRVTRMLHDHGVDCIIVDSDGNNDALIPLWLEAGVTGLRPFEAAAGCDPVAVRRRFGRSLFIQGGIDKRALAAGLQAIEREVLSKVPWLCLQGGYFPQVDHLVPPDVPLRNYACYAELVRRVVEDPERYLHQARARGYWP